jgi:uncharacterized protein
MFGQTQAPAPVGSAESQAVEPAVSGALLKIEPAKEADIRRLMDLIGTKKLVIQMMDAMEQNLKPLMTNALPAGEYRDKLVDLFFLKFHSKRDAQQILDLAVPAYDRYYTREEIRGLIEFYGTPLGQKTITVLPKLTGELQESGRKWGEQLGRDSMDEVLAEHPELATALESAKKGSAPPQ